MFVNGSRGGDNGRQRVIYNDNFCINAIAWSVHFLLYRANSRPVDIGVIKTQPNFYPPLFYESYPVMRHKRRLKTLALSKDLLTSSS